MKRRLPPLERKTIFRVSYWLVLTFLILSALFFSRHSIYQVIRKKIEINKLQAEVKKLKIENEQLRKENQELKSNPQLIEKLAREDHAYQGKDDIVFRFLPNNQTTEQKKKK